jgi:hypothetical protein
MKFIFAQSAPERTIPVQIIPIWFAACRAMASLLSFCIGGLMRIRTRSSTTELRVQVHGLIVCRAS